MIMPRKRGTPGILRTSYYDRTSKKTKLLEKAGSDDDDIHSDACDEMFDREVRGACSTAQSFNRSVHSGWPRFWRARVD